jgi:monoamine oxidase
MEMGATWFSKPSASYCLVRRTKYRILQTTPKASHFLKPCPLCLRKNFSDAEEPSYRIVGGTATLIEKLVASWYSKYQNTN